MTRIIEEGVPEGKVHAELRSAGAASTPSGRHAAIR